MVHGTTLVTNALIERTGARLGLITTRGFRDILEMGTEQRYDIYDLFLRFPDPLVPRRHRLEVAERIDRDGNVLTLLDPDELRAAAQRLIVEGIEAIAICFLHAYCNPAHEQQAAAIIRAAFPDIAVSISSDVVAELWEYQRCNTTCANAYVQPLMGRYIAKLERELHARGFRGDLRFMHSAGGLLSPETARDFPIRMLESGPAGGGLATAFFGEAAGHADVISFDMGGTTAKACLIQDGRAEIAPMMEAARVHRFKKGSGLPIKAPVIDMIEIGAGGGSIASIDEVGLLRVGPHSSGADPGPACYARGGIEPTVTDANLLLGYYDPGFFLGGRMALDRDAAECALAKVGATLGLSAIDTAWGIHRMVVENMAAAARIHIVEKGKDPRAYAMVGFGGAGPAHAAEVARVLGVRQVLIPPASGAASALGFLAAPLSFEQVRSHPVLLDAPRAAATIDAILRELTDTARARLADEAEVVTERLADMRLEGQMHEISVRLPDGQITDATMPAMREAFATAYAERYTSVYAGVGIMAVSFRVRCRGPMPQLSLTEAGARPAGAAQKGTRTAWFDGGFVDTPVYDRYALAPGARVTGPAIIEEREATTIIPPGDIVSVDATGTLAIDIGHATAPVALVTADTPIEQAAALIEADPVSLEIMWSRLVTVVEEMWHTICRTAFSLIVSEAQDFACDLLDARRRLARPFAARHAGVQPDLAARGEGAAGEIPARDAEARRRAGHQRSMALRRPPVRHRRRHAGIPQRRAGGAHRHGRPCRRHRRHQGLPARPRDLRGRHPDPADDAVPRRRSERRPVHPDRRERAQERGGARRHPLLHRRQRARRRTAAGVHGRVRHARPARARRAWCRRAPRTRCATRFARCRTACTSRKSGTIRWASSCTIR